MAIMQGTTPTHTFNLPFDTNIIKTVRIIYSQCGEKLFSRENKDDNVTLEGTQVRTTLTQQETLSMDPEKVVEIQLRIVTLGGEVANSRVIRVSAERCLEDEVIE